MFWYHCPIFFSLHRDQFQFPVGMVRALILLCFGFWYLYQILQYSLVRAAPLGVCDSMAWTVLAQAPSLLAKAQVGKAGISLCNPGMYGVDLRVENGQEAL